MKLGVAFRDSAVMFLQWNIITRGVVVVGGE